MHPPVDVHNDGEFKDGQRVRLDGHLLPRRGCEGTRMSLFDDAVIEPGDHDLGFGMDGLPTTATLANAIQVWSLLQIKQPVTVARDVATSFNVPPERVKLAVEYHYWMGLDGPCAPIEARTIWHEERMMDALTVVILDQPRQREFLPMKNKITDLNNHLFAQLERLSNEELSAEEIDVEVKRATAIIGISDQIAGAANLQLKAASLVASHGDRFRAPLAMLAGPAE